MSSDQAVFAGVDISSGRTPIALAVLDDGLEVIHLEQWKISDVISCLKGYDSIQLAINIPSSRTGKNLYMDFQNQIRESGVEALLKQAHARPWIESNAQESYRVFQPKLFPRRSIEGRIQRELILYEQGLQLSDPMDFFEEITRHKLIQGSLPVELLHPSKQLDALVMAYLAWLAGRPSERIMIRGDLTLPAPE